MMPPTPLGQLPNREKQLELMHRIYRNTLEQYASGFAPCESWAGYQQAQRSGKCATLLTVEDGAVIREMDMLYHLHSLGVRLVTLTWNFENSIGYPNHADHDLTRRGLKPFGRDVVAEMNRLGMLVDVSHLSDGGFYDVAETSTKPFVASHSCARSLAHHPRNLTDEMIRILADHGGICGVNFYPPFLTDDGRHISRISDMCRHVEHLRQVGGEDILALGSDFDGIEGALEIAGPQDMEKLFEALRHDYGYTENMLEKLAYRNAERVLQDCLPRA